MRRILITLLELVVMIAVFKVCNQPGAVKYVIVAFVSLGLMFLGRKKRRELIPLVCILPPMIVYLGLGCLNSLVTANIYTETIKIVVFWTLPLIFAFSLYMFYGENMLHIIDIQFIASALVYLITTARFLLNYYNSESMFAYAYGAFFVYYVYQKRWGMSTFAAALMWLADKRIVFIAAIVAILVQGILWLFRNDKRFAQGLWAIIALAANAYLWLIYSGTLEAFCKGVGINTNGRVKMFGQTVEWFGESFFAAGHGMGVVEELLSAWNIEKFSNLHNDLLKLHIELGFVGLLLYFISFSIMFYLVGKRFGRRKMSLFISMAAYTMILFATDNVSIYIIFLIPLYSIYFTVLADNKIEVVKEYDC